METSVGKRDIIQLDSLGDKPMINNLVLVKVDVFYDNGDIYTTKGGLKLIIAGGEWNEVKYVPRYGTVAKKPNTLITTKTHKSNGVLSALEWETDIDIEVGDTVFWGIMAGANAVMIECKGDVYFLINYGDLILRIRGEEREALNGYVLCSDVFDRKRSEILVLDNLDEQNKQLGVVKITGKPNRQYFDISRIDAEVEIGDRVVLNGRYWTELENEEFALIKERLGYVQSCWLTAKL